VSSFHVSRPRTRFRRYRGRRVQFSCFAHPDSFSAVPRVSGPVFIFCALGHVFGGAEGVRSHFHVFPSWTHFRRFRGRRVVFDVLLFSCFVLPDSFSTVPRVSVPVFMFFLDELIFGGTDGVWSRFRVFALFTLEILKDKAAE
jgi:hypothetical protein